MRWNKLISVVNCHTVGKIGKVVTGGILRIPGETMFEKKQFFETEGDPDLGRRRVGGRRDP